MAFDTLGIPAMSSEAKRTFSDSGEVIKKRRNRLLADNVSACRDNADAILWKYAFRTSSSFYHQLVGDWSL
jgi:hAT family C-terminal dimerisation region